MTKKGKPNKVQRSEAQERAYTSLKETIITKPVLRKPDHTKPFILRVDACEVGVGAVLMQSFKGKLFPIGLAGKKLSDRELKYSTIENECLAIVWSVKRFIQFIYGRKFVFQIEHQPLTYLDRAKFINDRITFWALFLQNHGIKIEAIKGMQ